MPVWIITKSGNDFLVKFSAHFIQMDGKFPHPMFKFSMVWLIPRVS